MSGFATLKNPPIVEAILDVQLVFPKGVDLEKLAALHSHFQSDYPIKEDMRIVQFKVQHKTGESPISSTLDQGIRGYRFLTTDKKEIIQCRRDGFTFNRLAPYGCWEDFIETARKAWDFYREAFQEGQIVRVGVRYINRFVLPFGEGEVRLDKYLKIARPGPLQDGLTFSSFLSRSTFNDATTGLDVNWIFAQQDHPDPSSLSIILDIDVFLSGPKAQESSPVAMWETMRELKNRLFFSTFQPKGLELFQ